MALIKYGEETFLKAIEPGIVSFIISSFKTKLEKELNGIIEKVYEDLSKELPQEIKAKVSKMMDSYSLNEKIKVDVIVDLSMKATQSK